MSKSLTVVSGAYEGAAGADDAEEHLGGSSTGRHGGTFPSSPSVAFVSNTSAAAADTVAWPEGNLATSVFHASSLSADRGSASSHLDPSRVATSR